MSLRDIRIENKDLRVILECGHILCEAARFTESEVTFRGMAEYLPNSEIPLIGLSNVYLQSQNFEKAESLCKKISEKFPESLYAKINFAEALFFCHRRQEAIKILTEIITESPNTPEFTTAKSYLEMAEIYFYQT